MVSLQFGSVGLTWIVPSSFTNSSLDCSSFLPDSNSDLAIFSFSARTCFGVNLLAASIYSSLPAAFFAPPQIFFPTKFCIFKPPTKPAACIKSSPVGSLGSPVKVASAAGSNPTLVTSPAVALDNGPDAFILLRPGILEINFDPANPAPEAPITAPVAAPLAPLLRTSKNSKSFLLSAIIAVALCIPS